VVSGLAKRAVPVRFSVPDELRDEVSCQYWQTQTSLAGASLARDEALQTIEDTDYIAMSGN
jgi:hypothetical protein